MCRNMLYSIITYCVSLSAEHNHSALCLSFLEEDMPPFKTHRGKVMGSLVLINAKEYQNFICKKDDHYQLFYLLSDGTTLEGL